MNDYINAIRLGAEHYKSKELIEATKLMVQVKNDLDKVKESYHSKKVER